MSARKETLGRTIGIVVAVCLACSIVVSSAAVGLRSLQETNAALDKQTNIIDAAGLLDKAAGDIAGTYDKYVEERFVDLETGTYVEAPYEGYDMFKAAKDSDYNVRVQGSNVGFQTRAKVASIYVVKDDSGNVQRLVLPVYGSGLWDLMYGFLAIEADGSTIRSLVYYQHKETPGLGGEIVNPAWKAKWDGKQAFKDGEVAIQVKKGAGNDNPYAVDALSGATLTSNGVQNSVTYWLGEQGFGKYLSKQSWKS
ncbi:Na(+)-translocating NADH-quinone reductase subunit C [Planctobacterium marinum]|uniref:Na(+)-translocating NADH-quinone reductase subunit C n=1 Tax=Planctobacterium marinum TaxID=1631968 RepID=A0AA48KNE6_9ALTE|nr:Na(+)-translocating NADH-quinone reductase subunit C [Planctobacterium marinum]